MSHTDTSPKTPPASPGTSHSSKKCSCTVVSSSTSSLLTPNCQCPRGELDIVIHDETCLMYKNETIIIPHEPETCECQSPRFEDGICKCCACLEDQCRCKKAGREVFDEWRKNRPMGAMPAVLEASHPLMQRFQETLKRFLEKENAIAEEEIQNLREQLRLSKKKYDEGLEAIYRDDHDTNAQRKLIEEYEANLTKTSAERVAAEQRARETKEKQKRAKEKLEEDIINERESTQELEALTTLCQQLESWREETESDLTVSQRMSDKMRAEKRALADEKRQLDMIIYSLTNEVWNLESKLELFQKQIEIKNAEMEKVNDKVTAYAAELEDLDLDKRRLVGLWNSVLVNIQQRDKVFDSVREDYKALQENYRTLVHNLDVTKQDLADEINKGKELAMTKDKILYDTNAATKLYDKEEAKRTALEMEIAQHTESIEMSERDQELIKSENQALSNILKTSQKEFDRKVELKLKLENDILANLQECLLNDKAVESMANGIKKMREMGRKQEIALLTMENQHAKLMLDIEMQRNKEARNKIVLEESQNKVTAKEKELEELEEKCDQKRLRMIRAQRDLDIISKKYNALKEIFDHKSPQERRIEELELQIRGLRERTEQLQNEWLRLQGHVVKLTGQHQKLLADINLINKQIQICEQKTMRYEAECEAVRRERGAVERALRGLRGRLEVLERTRRDARDRNLTAQRVNDANTFEYSANLKDAEMEIIQIEEEIEAMEKEKSELTTELDRVQREALIWQRKGIMAVELKRNIKNAKSAAGEIGQMKNEIHRMEVRREQLRRTSEKLSEDLAMCVTRRETAMDKSRAAAAVEKAHAAAGRTSQTVYQHKLRLAKCDLARVTKDLNEAKGLKVHLEREEERLEREIAEKKAVNAQMEEHIATLMRECRKADREKQWLLERVVRCQRLGKELATAIKRQSLKVRRPKTVVLAEYEQATKLNDRLRYIAETLSYEYPYLNEKIEVILNTLNIHSPSESPRLTEEGGSCSEALEEQEMTEYVGEEQRLTDEIRPCLYFETSEQKQEEEENVAGRPGLPDEGTSFETTDEEEKDINIAEKPFCYEQGQGF